MDRIEADYLIETAFPLEDAAAVMAGEQSSGTFLPVPGETQELKARAAARVERIEDLGPVAAPSLPGARRADRPHRQAQVTLSWPLANMGPSLPNLLATVAGNLFELGQFSGLRLLDLRLPSAFAGQRPTTRRNRVTTWRRSDPASPASGACRQCSWAVRPRNGCAWAP